MTWAQRLKRVFNIDIEICSRCGGSVRFIACIEEQEMAWVPAYSRTGMTGIDLRQERYERDFEIINDDRGANFGYETGRVRVDFFANTLFILPILGTMRRMIFRYPCSS